MPACVLCTREASGERAGLPLCVGCAREDLSAAYERLGMKQGAGGEKDEDGKSHLRIVTPWPRKVPLDVSFTREHTGHKVVKLFVDEVQAGDALFDDAIYVKTSTKDAVASLVKSKGLQKAVLSCVGADGLVEIREDALTVLTESVGELNEHKSRLDSLLLYVHVMRWVQSS